jgi:K(+)-stimulated pyrophosphate-energized sodium pump
LGGSFLAVNALELELGIFYAILLGAFAGVILYLLTEWYTSGPPVHRLAAASDAGSVSNLLAGVTVGMESTVLPVLTLCGAVLVAYNYAGVYGIGIAAVAMLTSCGAGISVYAMAPIADNALGIARFHRLGDETVRVASRLDSLGNTVAAVGKTCAIGTGALAAVALFSAYARAVGLGVLDLADPTVVVGLLLGGAVPFVIGDAVLSSSGKVAFRLLGAVRRFFEESPAPQYSDFRTAGVRLARIAGRQSLREMALPACVALGTPVGVGLVLGRSALGGTLAGVLLSGFLFALFMVQAGAAWDNAKALLERETEGRTHSAGVLGDTFGDPLKDAVGPSVNVVIRLMATVALLMAPWLR